MVRKENHLGVSELHAHYFSDLVGHTVTSCFGVSGMANSGASQGLRQFFFKNNRFVDQGVAVSESDGELVVELHIIISYGVNISAVVDSIKNKVRYTVKEATGMNVKKINVFVDAMKE